MKNKKPFITVKTRLKNHTCGFFTDDKLGRKKALKYIEHLKTKNPKQTYYLD